MKWVFKFVVNIPILARNTLGSSQIVACLEKSSISAAISFISRKIAYRRVPEPSFCYTTSICFTVWNTSSGDKLFLMKFVSICPTLELWHRGAQVWEHCPYELHSESVKLKAKDPLGSTHTVVAAQLAIPANSIQSCPFSQIPQNDWVVLHTFWHSSQLIPRHNSLFQLQYTSSKQELYCKFSEPDIIYLCELAYETQVVPCDKEHQLIHASSSWGHDLSLQGGFSGHE